MTDKFDSGRWYSTKEICEYLGIRRETALKWMAEKGMPAHRVGRLWKYKIDEIDEWVKSGQSADK